MSADAPVYDYPTTDPLTSTLRKQGLRGQVDNPLGEMIYDPEDNALTAQAVATPRIPVTITLREAFAMMCLLLAVMAIPCAGFLIGVVPTNVYAGLFATGGTGLVLAVLLGLG